MSAFRNRLLTDRRVTSTEGSTPSLGAGKNNRSKYNGPKDSKED